MRFMTGFVLIILTFILLLLTGGLFLCTLFWDHALSGDNLNFLGPLMYMLPENTSLIALFALPLIPCVLLLYIPMTIYLYFLWRHYFPRHKKWLVIPLCIAGVLLPVLLPLLMVFLVWKSRSKLALAALAGTAIFSVAGFFCDNMIVFGIIDLYFLFPLLAFIFAILLTAAVSPVKIPRGAVVCTWIFAAFSLLAVAGTDLALRHDRKLMELAKTAMPEYGIPLTRAQHDWEAYKGKPDNSPEAVRFLELAEKLDKLVEETAAGFPSPRQYRLNDDLRKKRDAFLETAAPVIAEMDRLNGKDWGFPYNPETPLVCRLYPECSAARQMQYIYAAQLQQAAERKDSAAFLRGFQQMRRHQSDPPGGGLIRLLLWIAFENVRLNSLADALTCGVQFTPDELRQLEQSLAEDEVFLRDLMSMAIRHEAFAAQEVIDIFLWISSPEGIPPGTVLPEDMGVDFLIVGMPRFQSIILAPFWAMAYDSRRIIGEIFSDFLRDCVIPQKDFRELPVQKYDFSDRFTKDSSTGLFLVMLIPTFPVLVERQHMSLFEIRCARYLIEKQLGKNPELPRDPFADAPVKLEENTEFTMKGDPAARVFGSRFISAGWKERVIVFELPQKKVENISEK